MRIILIVLAAIAASGCAVSNRYNYSVNPDLAPQGSRAVAVTTHDTRANVVSGERPPHFVGFLRSGAGIPYTVGTASGKPLAEEFNTAIAGALARRGFKASIVSVAAGGTPDIRAIAARSGADRVALVQLADWRTDTYMASILHYDLTLRIIDPNGKELANSRVNGEENLGTNAWNPPAVARERAPEAMRQKLQQLFGAPNVVAALR